jgi:hypothetical protein
MLAANDFYDFAQLLGASAKTADFQCDDRIAFLYSIVLIRNISSANTKETPSPCFSPSRTRSMRPAP